MMNPELEPFLKVWDAKWATLSPDADPAQRRAHFEGIAREMRLPTPEDVETAAEHWIETPAGKVRVREFRKRSEKTLPAMIYMHGGGWTQGSPETHWDITARLASWVGMAVYSVDYALAPEVPFPAAITQVIEVVKWVRREAGALGVDPAQITIGGDSAGGNLAACATLALRGTADMPMAQLLIYPATDFTGTRPSFTENAEGPIAVTRAMPRTWANYMPDPADYRNPLAAPLQAESQAGLPPTYLAVAQQDPLRDDGLALAEAMAAEGVEVELNHGPGLIHGYLRAMEYCSASADQLRHMSDWLALRVR